MGHGISYLMDKGMGQGMAKSIVQRARLLNFFSAFRSSMLAKIAAGLNGFYKSSTPY